MNNITVLSSAYSIPGSFPISGSDIISIIEDYFKMEKGDIKLKTRIREISKPRQIAIWMLGNRNISKSENQLPGWNKIIRDHFPLFDNATMIHSFKAVENDMLTNKVFRSKIHDIQEIIKQKEKQIKQYKMNVEQIAKTCYEVNKAYCESIGDYSQPGWIDAHDWQKKSVINGVKFHLENPDSKPSDSHNNWMKEKLKDGWKYGEKKDPEKKEHPCIVEYEFLDAEQQTKDKLFLSVVRSFE